MHKVDSRPSPRPPPSPPFALSQRHHPHRRPLLPFRFLPSAKREHAQMREELEAEEQSMRENRRLARLEAKQRKLERESEEYKNNAEVPLLRPPWLAIAAVTCRPPPPPGK